MRWMTDLTVCDWAWPCWALYHGKEMIKNLIELSDTETYKGVPAKHALILLLSALFFSSYTNCVKRQRVWKNPVPNWQENKVDMIILYIDFYRYFLKIRGSYCKDPFKRYSFTRSMLRSSATFDKLNILQGAEGLTHLSCRITKDEISTGGIGAKVSNAAQSSAMITPFWKTYKAERPASDGPGSSSSGS